MMRQTKHETAGPAFQVDGYRLTPVYSVSVTAYAGQSVGGVMGLAEPVAVLIVHGDGQWRIPIERVVTGEDEAGK